MLIEGLDEVAIWLAHRDAPDGEWLCWEVLDVLRQADARCRADVGAWSPLTRVATVEKVNTEGAVGAER
jgi:hypothetical protein